jgi:pyrroloquinoline quinone biosynthesis protein B
MLNLLLALLLLMPFGENPDPEPSVRLVVLGTIQDAGSPHIGCRRQCCVDLFMNPDPKRLVVSLGVIDESEGKSFLFEATPDIVTQMELLQSISGKQTAVPDGIFITHAHIGHYTGLMYLGREALGTNSARVYMMPRMRSFVENNGPWSQLVELYNIEIADLEEDVVKTITPNIRVTPVRVPHRDEYSETVGFRIEGPNKSLLYVPDVDKWNTWDGDIVSQVQDVDYALIDGTFFSAEELGYRDMREIPHPSVRESMDALHELSRAEKAKVYFIHLNHTNPLLDKTSQAYLEATTNGFKVAAFLDQFIL